MAGRGQGSEELAPLFGSGGDDASELRRETAEPRSGREVAQDRISSLCDDLLLKILVLLPLVEAIRTCILSRRWRGVWTRLPRLELDDGAARAAGVEGFVDLVDGALQHHSVDVGVDELLIRVSQPTSIDAARLAAWTAFAAERVKHDLTVNLPTGPVVVDDQAGAGGELELPSHARASDITWVFGTLWAGVAIRLIPTPGQFSSLVKLTLQYMRFTDAGAGISDVVSSRCPRLKTLRMVGVRDVRELRLRSATLEDLTLNRVQDLVRLNVTAPNLSAISVMSSFYLNSSTVVSVDAPALKKALWADQWPDQVDFGRSADGLKTLIAVHVLVDVPLWLGGGYANILRLLEYFKRVEVLELHLSINKDNNVNWHNILMERVKLPDHSELRLHMASNGHAFGISVSSLLKKCHNLRKFNLCLLDRKEDNACLPDCVCRQAPDLWGELSLDSLEELIVDDFLGMKAHADFLHSVLHSANMVRKVLITLPKHLELSRHLRDEIHSLCPSGIVEFRRNEW